MLKRTWMTISGDCLPLRDRSWKKWSSWNAQFKKVGTQSSTFSNTTGKQWKPENGLPEFTTQRLRRAPSVSEIACRGGEVRIRSEKNSRNRVSNCRCVQRLRSDRFRKPTKSGPSERHTKL